MERDESSGEYLGKQSPRVRSFSAKITKGHLLFLMRHRVFDLMPPLSSVDAAHRWGLLAVTDKESVCSGCQQDADGAGACTCEVQHTERGRYRRLFFT